MKVKVEGGRMMIDSEHFRDGDVRSRGVWWQFSLTSLRVGSVTRVSMSARQTPTENNQVSFLTCLVAFKSGDRRSCALSPFLSFKY